MEPNEVANNIRKFHHTCFHSSPTKAHQALALLAILKGTQIITENLDYLHERSGLMPYRIDANYLRTCVDPSTVRGIDYILCIGLSFDDKGFLGWYKQNHPNGKIIAIDLSQPSYLGDEDYLLTGDLQQLVPLLVENMGFIDEVM